jgi:hypothetical protein
MSLLLLICGALERTWLSRLGLTIEQELEGDGEVLESATKTKGQDPQSDVADLSDCC